MGFSSQVHWSGLPCPSPEALPNPGIEPSSFRSPALAGGFFTTCTTWEVHWQVGSSPLAPPGKPSLARSLLFSHSVTPSSLSLHRLQPPGLPCPSASPGACSSSNPLSQRCHQTVSSSAAPFSSCLQSFLASGFFQ